MREIVYGINNELRLQKLALEALQESAEMFVVQTFEDALLLTTHRRCVTVEAKDIKMVQMIKTPNRSSFQSNENDNTDADRAENTNAASGNSDEGSDKSD